MSVGVEAKGEAGGRASSRVTARFVALTGLAALAIGLGTVARGVYYAGTDGWMAPITLSPDNDQVLQINVKLNEQEVQRAKLRADIERIDADVLGIDQAMTRLHTIENNGSAALAWTAFSTNAQSSAARSRLRSLDGQRVLLDEMHARQKAMTESAVRNAEAGLISRQEVQREVQLLDQIELGRLQNERDAAETKMQGEQLAATTGAIAFARRQGGAAANGILPEIAAGQEREVRVELELTRLASEKRAMLAQRAISVESLTRMDDVLAQLKSRPQYRAVEANTDVAFVPYTQLDDVKVGAPIVSCKWVLFRCKDVGRVAEILPGEVVAQDPWAQIARGQYAILDLSDREAVKEKVLRARRVLP